MKKMADVGGLQIGITGHKTSPVPSFYHYLYLGLELSPSGIFVSVPPPQSVTVSPPPSLDVRQPKPPHFALGYLGNRLPVVLDFCGIFSHLLPCPLF